MTDDSGATQLVMSVDEAVVDIPCTGPAAVPTESGHFVGFRVTVSMGAAAPSGLSLDASSFTHSGGGGATAAAAACLGPEGSFPSGALAPGQQYAGTIVLDLSAPTGTLGYRPAPDAAGARWSF